MTNFLIPEPVEIIMPNFAPIEINNEIDKNNDINENKNTDKNEIKQSEKIDFKPIEMLKFEPIEIPTTLPMKNDEQPVSADEVAKSDARFTTKSKNFIMTVHEKAEKKLDKIIEKLQGYSGYRYILVTRHSGERKVDGKPIKPHYHIYVQYSTDTELCNKLLCNIHMEKCYGSAQSNIKYLMAKDNKPRHKYCTAEIYYEDGVPALKGGAIRTDDVIAQYEEGKNPDVMMSYQYYNVARRILEDHNRFTMNEKWIESKLRQKEDPMIVNYHIGKPGAGKTTALAEQYHKYKQEEYVIMEFDDNGFAHMLEPRNPNKVKYMMINEFRDSNIKFKYFLEILQNEHIFNIKGSQQFYPNLHQIDITTVQHPHQIYKNCCEDREQIRRRITNTYYWSDFGKCQKVETVVDECNINMIRII